MLACYQNVQIALDSGKCRNSPWTALYDATTGYFANNSRQNLSGVSFFWIKTDLVDVWYEMKHFLNPYSLESTSIPKDFALAFRVVDRVQTKSDKTFFERLTEGVTI